MDKKFSLEEFRIAMSDCFYGKQAERRMIKDGDMLEVIGDGLYRLGGLTFNEAGLKMLSDAIESEVRSRQIQYESRNPKKKKK